MAFAFDPNNFKPQNYGLPTLDPEVLLKTYWQYVDELENLKSLEETETKSDGTKRTTKLEAFVSGKPVNETVSENLNRIVSQFFTLAIDDPEQFAVALYELRSIMNHQIKGFADAVLPEVLANVTVANNETDDEETAELRHELFGLRQAIQKQLEAFTSLEIPVSIPKKSRNTRGGMVEVFDLPKVPGTRSYSEDSSVGRPKNHNLIHFVNGSEVPVGTTRAKLALLLSNSAQILNEFDIEFYAHQKEQDLTRDFVIEFPNGSVLEGNVRKQ